MGRKSKYITKENCFDKQDEYFAYILGLIYSDGCLKNYLTFTSKDDELLKYFGEFFYEGKYPTYSNGKNQEYIRVIPVFNIKITNLCNKYGIEKRKTFTLKFPEFLPKILQNHFIRGYFDGDGCITGSKIAPHFSLIGTKEFLLRTQEILISECNLYKTILGKRHKDNKNNYNLRYCGHNICTKIKDYLYKDSKYYLNRKYLKFEELTKPHPINICPYCGDSFIKSRDDMICCGKKICIMKRQNKWQKIKFRKLNDCPMIPCKYCGKLFERVRKIQIICGSEECVKRRNRDKDKRHKERKKIEKAKFINLKPLIAV